MSVMWLNVGYVVKCLVMWLKCRLCGQMSVMWSNVGYVVKCLLYGQMSVIWSNVGNMVLNVGNMVKCR